MLARIIERVRRNITARELRRMPALKIGLAAIDMCWLNGAASKDFPAEEKTTVSEQMADAITKIALSADPRMTNREALTNSVIELARFQVLVISPAPADDATGLRGQAGITGELKERLLDLSHTDDDLVEVFSTFDTPRSWDEAWSTVLLVYRASWARAHVFHLLREAFGDMNPADDWANDWFQPYVAAMCGWQEDVYRRALGMPSALDEEPDVADLKSLALYLFMEWVMKGVKYPDLEWEKQSAEFKFEKPLTLTRR